MKLHVLATYGTISVQPRIIQAFGASEDKTTHVITHSAVAVSPPLFFCRIEHRRGVCVTASGPVHYGFGFDSAGSKLLHTAKGSPFLRFPPLPVVSSIRQLTISEHGTWGIPRLAAE